MSIDKLKAFLASSDVLTFKGNLRVETYARIERTLRFYRYPSRPRSEQFLKKGTTMDHLREVERQHRDTECAKLLREKKAELFCSFSKPGIFT